MTFLTDVKFALRSLARTKWHFLQYAGARGVGISPPYPRFERFRSQARHFSGMGVYGGGDFKVTLEGRAERISGPAFPANISVCSA